MIARLNLTEQASLEDGLGRRRQPLSDLRVLEMHRQATDLQDLDHLDSKSHHELEAAKAQNAR